MSNYTKLTDFAAKDALATGNANKIVKGTEIDDEFEAIETAIATKADQVDLDNIDLSSLWPVGSVYINAGVSTNPSTLLGFGTWVAIGAGRVLVGLDSGDTDFDTLGETGGSKDTVLPAHTHTGTTDSNGDHQHNQGFGTNAGVYGNDGTSNRAGVSATNTIYSLPKTSTAGAHTHTITTDSTGTGDGTGTNVQPYLVVHMWQRTA